MLKKLSVGALENRVKIIRKSIPSVTADSSHGVFEIKLRRKVLLRLCGIEEGCGGWWGNV